MDVRHVGRGVVIGLSVLMLWLTPSQLAGAQEDCDPLLGCEPGYEGDSTSVTPAPTVPVASSAATQAPDPAAGSVSTAEVNPTTVAPGQTFTVRGGGSFARNERLEVHLSTSPPSSLGNTQSDATGRYSATVAIPDMTAHGTYTVTVSGPGAGGNLHESRGTVTVGLAHTGAITGIMALAGAAAVGTGARLVIQSQWSRPVSTRNGPPRRRRGR